MLLGSSEFKSIYVQISVILLPNRESKFYPDVVSSIVLCLDSGILSVQAQPALVTSLCCFTQSCLRAVLLLLCQMPTIPWVKLLSLADWVVILCMKIKVVEGTWEANNLKYWSRLSSSRRCWFFRVSAVEQGQWPKRPALSETSCLRLVSCPSFSQSLGHMSKVILL